MYHIISIPFYIMFFKNGNMMLRVGPPFTIAKLVNVTPISLWFMVTIVTGVISTNL